MLPSPDHSGLGLRGNSYRGHLWVHFRCGPVTRSPSQGRLCRLASSASFPPRNATQATGFRLFPRWDSPPTEHASLSLVALWSRKFELIETRAILKSLNSGRRLGVPLRVLARTETHLSTIGISRPER